MTGIAIEAARVLLAVDRATLAARARRPLDDLRAIAPGAIGQEGRRDDDEWRGFMAYDPARARAAGLHPRPLQETLTAVLDYENHRPAHKPRPSGLTDDEERALIEAWRAR